MEQAQHVGANDKILILGGIDVEVPVVHSSSKHRIIVRNRHDPISIFHDVLHVPDFAGFRAENHGSVKIPVSWSGQANRGLDQNRDRPSWFARSRTTSLPEQKDEKS